MKMSPANVACCALVAYSAIGGAMWARHRPRPPHVDAAAAFTVVDGWREIGQAGQLLAAGSSGATLVVFSDFQCPYCRRFAAVVDSLRVERPELRIVERQYPLRSIHPVAEEAAVAAECSARVGAYSAVRGILFSRPDLVAHRDWHTISDLAGIPDTAAIAMCVRERIVASRLVEDRQAAARLGVRGTPTVLLNDRLYSDGVPSRSTIDSVVRYARHR